MTPRDRVVQAARLLQREMNDYRHVTEASWTTLDEALAALDATPPAPSPMAAGAATVRIVSVDPIDYGYDHERLVVYVNGECVGFHSYGGEPEDNSRCRDYHWVEPLLALVAERCGATVEIRKLCGEWNEKLPTVEDAVKELEKVAADGGEVTNADG